ncbi:sugar ABC transporter ATP-binding protein [Labrys miyagiensis]
MADISFRKVVKKFGEVGVVHDFSLDVADREFIVFLGPSGCGKSTLLRMLAGLENISSGEIAIGGRVVNDLTPRERDVAMVFQNYALYPHMSVYGNIAFGLKRMKIAKAEIDRRVHAAAATLGLEPFLDRKSTALSGGQQQRVAIARAIVKTPGVFLFDEPLSNLDAKLRNHMRVEIARLHQRLSTTTVYVTHDQLEAMTLADRIVLLRDGVIQQVGTPREIFERPRSQFVAAFIGTPAMNFIDVDLHTPAGITIDRTRFELEGRSTVVAGIRPAHFRPAQPQETSNLVEGTVDLIEFLGNEALISLQYAGVELGILVPAGQCPAVGDRIRMTFDPENLHVFDRQSGASLRRSDAERSRAVA